MCLKNSLFSLSVCFFLSVSTFGQSLPPSYPNLKLWLRADSVIASGTSVSQWNDLSGNGFHALQGNSNFRPLKVLNGLGDKPVLRFDGTNDNMLTTFGATVSQPNTIFIVWKTSINTQRVVLDDLTNVCIDNSSGSVVRMYSGGVGIQYSKTSPFNFILTTAEFNTTTSHLYENGILKTTGTVGNAGIPGFSIGKRYVNNDRFFNGDVAEIIFYDRILSPSEREGVEKYIFNRYAPPVNLGADVIKQNFCPLDLHAGSRFTSFLWSNGSTNESLTVTQAGTYWVEAKNIFGITSRDTINVTFPVYQTPTRQSFCPTQSTSWNLGLGAGYTYLWNNGVTNETIQVSISGNYFATITDSAGCQITTSVFYFNEDPYATNVSLGPDLNLCSGNSIGLVSGANETSTYLWNTGETSASIIINSSGTYRVNTTNINGCAAVDSIHVNILGTAPVVQNNLDSSYCEGAPFNYQDLSTTSDGSHIITRNWDFGNGDISSDIGGEYTYPLPGQYNVTLNVVTDAGCFNTAIQPIRIFPRPDVDFYATTGCPNQPVTFNFDFVNSTNVAQWYWDFGVPTTFLDTSTDTNGVWTYNQSGQYPVFLRGTSVYGCSDSITKTITIKPSATPNFGWQGLCYGKPTQFFNQSTPENGTQVTGYEWNFGPGITSSFINPAVVFDSANVYPVSLKIFTASGCSETVTLQVPVNKGVNAAFDLADSLCAKENINLLDQSQGVNDNIVSWVWRFGGNTTISGQSPTFAFQNTGNRIVRLTTVTSAGCADSTQQNVFVRPAAEANFSLTIHGGTPPFKPIVTNHTAAAVSYAWYIDGVLFSNAFEPVFPSYTDTGTYQITLVAENAAGCSSETEKSFVVFTGDRTLQLIEANCIPEGDFMKYSARVFNKGALEVSEITFGANTDYNSVIREVWTGSLMPGQVLDYQLQSSAKYYTSADFCCVRIDAFNDTLKVQSPDNEICLPLTEQAWFSVPYPTPTNGMVTVDYIFPFADKFSATLCEIDGKVIKNLFTNQSAGAGFGSFTSDISDVKAGMYIIRLAYRDRFFSVKVIKQ